MYLPHMSIEVVFALKALDRPLAVRIGTVQWFASNMGSVMAFEVFRISESFAAIDVVAHVVLVSARRPTTLVRISLAL